MALAWKTVAVSATSASLPGGGGAGIKDAGVFYRCDVGPATAARKHGAKSGRALAMSHMTRPRIRSERVKDVLAFLVALALTLFIKLV
jgi:hypothetical protein